MTGALVTNENTALKCLTHQVLGNKVAFQKIQIFIYLFITII